MARTETLISEKSLHHWKLLDRFRAALEKAAKDRRLHPSFKDPERRLQLGHYLSLFLFGLLNPALKSARALCSASHLARVQEQVCGRPVSLGSFSEAQHLVDPAFLEKVFGDLAGQMSGRPSADPRLAWQQWFARDGSLFSALPRMVWALYGGGHAGCPNRAVRLHLDFEVCQDRPAGAQVRPGRDCERKVWQENWKAGAGYVGDRYFSKNFQLFGQLQQKGCSWVIRLIEEATVNILEPIALTEADRRAGVVRQAWATLGKNPGQSIRMRVVWIEGKDSALMLITNVPPEDLPAELVSLLYRRRWQIECFFRWLKCLLQCRHWLAESARGVSLQLYLALIAAVLLQLALGRRPNQRMFELIQMHQMGWATTEELIAGLAREEQREACRKKIH